MPAPVDFACRQLTIELASGDLNAAEDLLTELGAAAITLADAADQALLEPAPGTTPLWRRLQLEALFPAAADPAAITRRLEEAGLSLEVLQWSKIPEKAWERVWMDRFQPMHFAGRLWVAPHHTALALTDDQAVLRLDPGLAFGTGGHPTTALCLQAIAAADWRGCTALDYGCGSGILGLAAALLGAKQVWCADYDPQALIATLENARLNRLAERLVVTQAETLPAIQVDWIFANILAGTLIDLAPILSARLKPSAHLLLSGLLPEQTAQVIAAYEPAIGAWAINEKDGWCCLHGRAAMM